MCGIGGFCDFQQRNGAQERGAIGKRMCGSLERRGSDDGGIWLGTDCVLVHRRLAVIDPHHGQQPMVRMDGTGRQIVLVYNGELYNTDALRRTTAVFLQSDPTAPYSFPLRRVQ